jgi:hypothetical protein
MAWLLGYSYRKEITVSNADNSVTWLLIGKTSDAVGEDVDCGGHCLDTFYDLRFTEADGTTIIPHYRDTVVDSGGTKLAIVAIKNTTETTAYMYYGKADASDSSSGTDTFGTFDNFERGNDGDAIGGNWTIVTGDVDISTDHAFSGTRCMKLIGGATVPDVTIPQTAGTAYAIRFRLWKEDASQFYFRHGDGTERINFRIDADEDIETYNGAYQDTGHNLTAGQWELIELTDINHSTPKYDLWLNGSKIADDADTWENAAYSNVIGFTGNNVATTESYIDDLIVYKWSVTPQSFAFGNEVHLNITVDIDALLQDTDTSTVAIDAYIQATDNTTITVDALLAALGSATVDVDALLRDIVTSTIDLDAYIQQTDTTTIDIDALIAQLRDTTIDIDALIASLINTTIDIDSLLQSTVSTTITIDCYIGELDHEIVDGEYLSDVTRINRVLFVGKDENDNAIYSLEDDDTDLGQKGEVFQITRDTSITTQAAADLISAAKERKQAIFEDLGYIKVQPNCAQQMYDVITIVDSTCGVSRTYRVIGITLEYDTMSAPSKTEQVIKLGNV